MAHALKRSYQLAQQKREVAKKSCVTDNEVKKYSTRKSTMPFAYLHQCMLKKIQDFPGTSFDVVAKDLRYNIRCMNRYLNSRRKIINRDHKKDIAFGILVDEIHQKILIKNDITYLMKHCEVSSEFS